MRYRLCLLGKSSDIRAAEAFLAEDDVRANEIALSVFSACCDDFDGYEIWNGATMISCGRGPQPPGDWRAITQASQREVLDLEDRMQRTFACVSKSRQLLDATARLRTLIAGESDLRALSPPGRWGRAQPEPPDVRNMYQGRAFVQGFHRDRRAMTRRGRPDQTHQ
jgi:hypothetical protein